MKGIGAVLLAAGAAFAAAGGSEPAAADSLESQLLRFEAVTALGGTSVFKYEHLVPAATDVSTLPATVRTCVACETPCLHVDCARPHGPCTVFGVLSQTGVPVKNMLTTCANDVESLCQVRDQLKTVPRNAPDLVTPPAPLFTPRRRFLQRTFGNDIASEKSRADAVKKGLVRCL